MPRIGNYLRTIGQDYAGARRLAADSRSFRRLATDFMLYRLMKVWRPANFNQERSVTLKGGTTLHYRLNRGDIWVIHEVWIEQIYRYPIEKGVNVLVDIGANIGMTSLWMAKEYGYSRIIAVEPSEDNADLVRKNLLGNGLNAEVVCAAAGGKDGFTLFAVSDSSTNGRVDTATTSGEVSATDAGHVSVPVVSMPTLLQNLPPDMMVDTLKIDIEGGEEDLLSGNVDWLNRIKTMLVEFHPNLIDYPAVRQILQRSGWQGEFPEPAGSDIIDFLTREPAAVTS